MIDKIWSLRKVNKPKVFEVLNFIVLDNQENTEYLITLEEHLASNDDFQSELHEAITQTMTLIKKDGKVDEELRAAGVDLLGTLGRIEEKHKYIKDLAVILIKGSKGDIKMKNLLIRAINNFILPNRKDLLAEGSLIEEFTLYIDACIGTPTDLLQTLGEKER
jgi:hypothetical protein